MIATKKVLLGAIATVVFASACTTVTVPSIPPIPTLPPINIPSLPPINIPSLPPINIPSIPPIDIPSGLIPTPVPAGDSTCRFVTAEEMAAIFGGPVNLVPGDTGDCTITPSTGSIGIVMRIGQGETLQVAKLIASTNGQDLTVAGLPAWYGEFLGGILYVERNGNSLVLQAPLDNAAKDKLVAIANAAVPRWQ